MKKQKLIGIGLVLLTVVLIAVSVLSICQSVHYYVVDHNLQLQEFGFVKDDITMLSFEQTAWKNALGIIGIFSIIGALISGFFGITLLCDCYIDVDD